MLELVLVITLMGILGLSLATLFDVGTVPFQSAVEKLKHDIRHAQWEALSRKKRYGVVFDASAETYSVYQTNTSNIISDPLNPSNDFTVNYATDNKFRNVEILAVDINGTDQIEFDGRGFPYDANNNMLPSQGTITLSHDGNTVTITIEPNTGRVN